MKFIAYLDILGFKEFIFKNDHEYALTKMRKTFEGTIDHIHVANDFLNLKGFTKDRINSLQISDSLILWTDNISSGAFLSLILQVESALVTYLLDGFPLRGYICKGELDLISFQKESITNNICNSLIGKGLVNAFLSESKQNWSGAIIDEELYYELLNEPSNENNFSPVKWLFDQKVIVQYLVPFKDDPKLGYAINWTRLYEIINTNIYKKELFSYFTMHGKNISKEDAKYLNTRLFHETMKTRK